MASNVETIKADGDDESSLADVARRVVKLLDLTSLGDADSESDIVKLCRQAAAAPGLVASVCIWPRFVGLAVEELAGTQIAVCAVANFPLGANDPAQATADALQIIDAGGAEIDVVIPWRALRDGERGAARRMISGIRDAVGSTPIIKAILETGELSDAELISIAGREAIAGGADFLKTSTGKTSKSATPAAAKTLLELIRDDTASTGHQVGLKVSGGVRTVDQARVYLALADEIMGPDWANRSTFRFGASSVLSDIREVLTAS